LVSKLLGTPNGSIYLQSIRLFLEQLVTAHSRLFLSLEYLFIHTGGRNKRHGGGGGGGGSNRGVVATTTTTTTTAATATTPALLVCVVRQKKQQIATSTRRIAVAFATFESNLHDRARLEWIQRGIFLQPLPR
jgi:hypothetical protein